MTSPSKDDGMKEALADQLLDAFEDAVRERAEDGMSYRPRVDGPRDEAREALRNALLSSSAAASGVREALETIQSAYEDQNLSHRDFRILAGTTAAEAINGEQNG
jgi:hypothetical protein